MLLLLGLCLDLWFGDTKFCKLQGGPVERGKERMREREKRRKEVLEGGREEGKSNVLIRVNSWTWDNFNGSYCLFPLRRDYLHSCQQFMRKPVMHRSVLSTLKIFCHANK